MNFKELTKIIGETGLCPICGENITVTGLTSNARLIGSCKDAFTVRQWKVTLWDLLDDWESEGYGIALVDKEDNVIDEYVDAGDYPDMILSKSGNGAIILNGKYKDGYIKFHSGVLEK